MSRNNSNTRLASLEVGRAVAATLVCLFHYSGSSQRYFGGSNNLDWFEAGGVAGVSYFFVLSGFIIYWIHKADIGINGALITFAKKRFIRLYPIYWIIFIPVAIAMLLVPGLGDEKNLSLWRVILDMLLIPRSGDLVIPPAWTLHRELLFYAFFSVCIWRPQPGFALLIVWQLCCLANGIFHITPPDYKLLVNVLFGHQNLGFGLGVIVAWILSSRTFNKKTSLYLAAAGFISFFGLIIWRGYIEVNPGVNFNFGFLSIGFAMCSFAIILGAVSYEKQESFHLPGWLVTFGGSSYVLYLIHLPTGSAIYKILSISYIKPYLGPNIAFIIAVLGAIFIASYVHLKIEKPLLKWGRRILLSKQ